MEKSEGVDNYRLTKVRLWGGLFSAFSFLLHCIGIGKEESTRGKSMLTYKRIKDVLKKF